MHFREFRLQIRRNAIQFPLSLLHRDSARQRRNSKHVSIVALFVHRSVCKPHIVALRKPETGRHHSDDRDGCEFEIGSYLAPFEPLIRRSRTVE
jgi:hypothetical protein